MTLSKSELQIFKAVTQPPNMPVRLRPLWLLYALLLTSFAFFSYGLTAPNLVLTAWAPYWNFQTWMWATFFNQRQVLTQTYLLLLTGLFIIYSWLWYRSQKYAVTFRSLATRFMPWWIALLIPLFLGYNALSFDIFNYIFNARMIVLYQVSPYHNVALDFPLDNWTRFMHNIHTFSPYGYGWTSLSLLPYMIGMGKFLPTWLVFKAFSCVSLLLLWVATTFRFWSQKAELIPLAPLILVFLNPLILLEFGLTGHNDLWMMAPAVASLWLVSIRNSKYRWPVLALSLALLAFSISIKIATIVLIPIWLILLITSVLPESDLSSAIRKFWPVAASLALLSLLTTARSQYFHPWYLSWVIVWLPFYPTSTANRSLKLSVSFIKLLIICFSFTSLLRYVPWLLTGEYPDWVIFQQRLITWAAVPLSTVIFLGNLIWEKQHQISRKSRVK